MNVTISHEPVEEPVPIFITPKIRSLEMELKSLKTEVDDLRLKKDLLLERIKLRDQIMRLHSQSGDHALPWLESVLVAAGEAFSVTTREIVSMERGCLPACDARQVCMALIREYSALPFSEIGRLFCNRDHGTVLHAVRSVKNKSQSDPHFREKLEAVRKVMPEAIP